MFIPLLIIIFLSIFAFFPSFHLALFGDDWLAIYRYLHFFGPDSKEGTNYFTYFVGGYGAYEITTGTLYTLFGPESNIYYIISYIFRLIAAFSVWPIVFYLSRSKLAAFYASLFLSITTIGLETTDWVFNLTSYLTIASLSLFLFFFIKSRENLRIMYFVIAAVFFYLAHIFAPVRMTGLLPFTIFLEIFLNFKSFNIILAFKRLFAISIIFGFITMFGAYVEKTETSGTLLDRATQIANEGFNNMSILLQGGRTDFLFYPVMTVGRLIIPYSVKPQIPTLFFGLIIFLGTLTLNIPNGKKIIFSTILGIGVWSAISWILYLINRSTLSFQDTISLAIGGYFLIIGTILMIYYKNQLISTTFFLGIFWTVFSFIFPWVRAPETLHPTEHRYLIPSSIGIAIFFASIIGLGYRIKNRVNLFLLVISFVIINTIATRSFFIDVVENSHGAKVMNKIWSSFPYIPEIGQTEKPLVFYFDSTPSKQSLKHHSLTFGFPFRIALKYRILDEQTRLPMVSNNWSDIISAVSDGNSLARSGYPKEKVPIENIYAFYLTDGNNLINITEETRDRLRKETIKN